MQKSKEKRRGGEGEEMTRRTDRGGSKMRKLEEEN